MLLEQLERQVLADRQALLSRGVTEDLPFFPTVAATLRERWTSEPGAPDALAKALTPEEAELRQALRVA